MRSFAEKSWKQNDYFMLSKTGKNEAEISGVFRDSVALWSVFLEIVLQEDVFAEGDTC